MEEKKMICSPLISRESVKTNTHLYYKKDGDYPKGFTKTRMYVYTYLFVLLAARVNI